MKAIKLFFKRRYEELAKVERHILFWHAILLIGLILSLIFNPFYFIMFQIFGTILSFGAMFDGDISESDIWIFFTAIPWICIALVGIGYVCYFIYKNTLYKLNVWLNKPRKNA